MWTPGVSPATTLGGNRAGVPFLGAVCSMSCPSSFSHGAAQGFPADDTGLPRKGKRLTEEVDQPLSGRTADAPPKLGSPVLPHGAGGSAGQVLRS